MMSSNIIGEYVEFIYCECNCGQTLAKFFSAGFSKNGKQYFRKDRFPRFKNGHNMKLNKKWDEANPQWKGDDVGLASLHFYVRRRLPKPERCQRCNKYEEKPSNIQLANITGVYSRDLKNWMYLCALCHYHEDIDSHRRDPFTNQFLALLR